MLPEMALQAGILEHTALAARPLDADTPGAHDRAGLAPRVARARSDFRLLAEALADALTQRRNHFATWTVSSASAVGPSRAVAHFWRRRDDPTTSYPSLLAAASAAAGAVRSARDRPDLAPATTATTARRKPRRPRRRRRPPRRRPRCTGAEPCRRRRGDGRDQADRRNASAAPNLSTLVTAVKAAGLDATLSGPGPFTVFAPTNDAFGRLAPGTRRHAAEAREQGVAGQGADLSRRAGHDHARRSCRRRSTAGGGKATLTTVEGEPLTAIDGRRRDRR